MRKIEEIKHLEVDALQEITDHLEIVMNDIEIYQEYLSKKDKKVAEKCRKQISRFWEQIENKIIDIFDADDRINEKGFLGGDE